MNALLWPRLQPAFAPLGLSALVLALLFHAEIGAAVHVWDSSTAYGHCWLILPIAIFLGYERRADAATTPMSPHAALAVLALPFAALWLAADLLGIMEGRQLALIGFVEVVLLAALGRALFTALAAGFLYLVFLVPFGAFVTPALQGFTTAFITHGLTLLGIANHASGNTIEIPEGVFFVAEACAGLRFLIASVAFGVLYALTMFTSPGRRWAFVAASIIVPIIANGVRALGIVVLGHALGSADAAAADHLLYGWIFFSLVVVALAALGLPFRQDAPPPPPPQPPPPTGTALRAIYAVWPALLCAVAGPAAALALEAHTAAPSKASAILLAPPSCSVTVQPAATVLEQTFTCGGTQLLARTLLLPARTNPSQIVTLAQAQAAILLSNADLDHSNLAHWSLDVDHHGNRAVATGLFIDGAPASGTLRDRIHLAAEMLSGRATNTVVLAVAVVQPAGDAVRALSDFLAAQGDLNERVVAASRK